jgi:5-carboxyvanillate decarboxylase
MKAGQDQPRIIAVEEHFLTESYVAEIANLRVPADEEPERAFMSNLSRDAMLRNRLTDMDTRLKEMDQAAIDVSVLSLNPPGVQIYDDTKKAVSLVQDMNDRLAEIVQSRSGRFGGLGSLAPQDPKRSADEVKRIMGPLGLAGVLIASHTHGRYLDHPECEPILAALEEEDATLYLHPRCPSPQMLAPFLDYGMIAAVWGFQAEAGTHAIRLILSGVLDRHPNLKIVLGHLGEALPFWLWRLDNIHQRTYQLAGDALGMVKLKMKPTEYIRRNFAISTSGMFDSRVLRYCVDAVGADKILFAVDYPYEDSNTAARFLKEAEITEGERDLISHGNAERLFRLPASSPVKEMQI